MSPESIYTNRLVELQTQLKKLKQKKSVLGVVRFGSIVAVIAGLYFLWAIGIFVAFGAGFIMLVLFARLVYIDLSNRSAIRHLEQLIAINQEELKAVAGMYFQFDEGLGFLPKEHPYASDLDLFGHASLYQWLNRTTSDIGARQLADWLLTPAAKITIAQRQEAVKEIATKMAWHQDLQAIGKQTTIKNTTYKRLTEWTNEPPLFLQFVHWKWLRFLLPAIIITVVVTAIAGLIPMSWMYAMLLVFAVLAYQLNKIIAPVHDRLSKIVDEIAILSQSAELIEQEKFDAAFNKQLQAGFFAEGKGASAKIGKLKSILDRLDLRYNLVLAAPLNLLLLWNLQQVLALEKWKKEQCADLSDWFLTLGRFETLISFAVMHFNNPSHSFPVLHEEHFYMKATALGHPLINKQKRVDNFIDIESKGILMLVTGSNMAGKSTYLRSVGVNTILAMAGAPVCATFMELSVMQLISSMRIADNLEESTSTFYAELKKLKLVIDNVNAGEKVFILLDEILRGTNSLDRHTGSAALIKQLIRKEAAGIIATHDLGLADIKEAFPENILNFHFDVQVNNEELYFDYKLKPGVCTSLNASILMKKIGIDL